MELQIQHRLKQLPSFISMSAETQYVLISPAKDEEKFIARTIESVLKQGLLPVRWIIVDDGSQDRTAAIVRSYAAIHPWITLVQTEQATKRVPGSAVVRAFNVGYETIRGQLKFDFVVKLDCDLELPPDYFENMIRQFHADERLGIASGAYLEQERENWLPVKMPSYHAAGAAKMIRSACFEEIGGFIPRRGWDTVDEIRAQMKGWRTEHFPELTFYHLRHEGSAVGFLRTNRESGAGHYLMGGGGLFLALKALQRAVRGRPPLLAAAAMAYGYVDAWLRQQERFVTPEEARYYRQLLNSRISAQVTRVLPTARSLAKGE